MIAIEPVLHTFVDAISQYFLLDYSTALGILVAIVCFLVTLVIFLAFRVRPKRGNLVALVGPSDSGKTKLFAELIGVTGVSTYTSMKENVQDNCVFAKKNLCLVDVPGSEKIRQHIFQQYIAKLRAFVFVIDSATFSKQSKDVAEYLYDLLCNQQLAKLPCLIACNKQDEPLVKSSSAIRSQLEKEFNLLNKSRTATLESTHGGPEKRVLGKTSKEFAFADLGKVEFCECSLKDLKSLKNWLARV